MYFFTEPMAAVGEKDDQVLYYGEGRGVLHCSP